MEREKGLEPSNSVLETDVLAARTTPLKCQRAKSNPGLSRGLIVRKSYADPLEHDSPNDPLPGPFGYHRSGGRLHEETLH